MPDTRAQELLRQLESYDVRGAVVNYSQALKVCVRPARSACVNSLGSNHVCPLPG